MNIAAIGIESIQFIGQGNSVTDDEDTAPHEIGHLFGALHVDDGLMLDELTPGTKPEDFSEVTLDKIRSANYP